MNQIKKLRFSVIVPVYKQWHLVPQLLRCLAEQTFSQDRFEVILVNNTCPKFSCPSLLPDNTRVLNCDIAGSYASRNQGAKYALGQILAFTDADCLPSSDWLQVLSQTFESEGMKTLVGGRVDMVSTAARPNVWEIFDMIKGIPQEWYVSRGYAATANLAIPKPVFQSVGEFDGRRFSGGDFDFCRRAGEQGHSIVYCSGACVSHPARTTWSAISTKARRIKGGQLLAGSLRNRRRWLIRAFLPPIFSTKRFLGSSQSLLTHRIIATLVLFLLWGSGMMEAVRLILFGGPERE